MTDDGKRVSEAKPDPASTKQTTADLRDPLKVLRNSEKAAIADALEALAAENERLHGIEERAKAEIVSAQACIDYDTAHPVGMGLIGAEASRTKDRISRILHGDANAGGGE